MAVGLGPIQVNLDEGTFWTKLILESIKYKGRDGALNGKLLCILKRVSHVLVKCELKERKQKSRLTRGPHTKALLWICSWGIILKLWSGAEVAPAQALAWTLGPNILGQGVYVQGASTSSSI